MPQKKKHPGGRPPKEFDKDEFEKLCALQCTQAEILDWFNTTDKTFRSWVRRTYNKSFTEIYKLKRQKGMISLRRSQFKLAEKSATMAIWLGKQYLGQRNIKEEEW